VENPQNWSPLGLRRLGIFVVEGVVVRSSLNLQSEIENPKKWDALGQRRSGTVAWLISPKTSPVLMCYRAKFGRSALKGIGINTGEPQKWGALELRLSWDEKRDIRLSLTSYHFKIGNSASNGVRINITLPK